MTAGAKRFAAHTFSSLSRHKTSVRLSGEQAEATLKYAAVRAISRTIARGPWRQAPIEESAHSGRTERPFGLNSRDLLRKMVGARGFEPPTPRSRTNPLFARSTPKLGDS